MKLIKWLAALAVLATATIIGVVVYRAGLNELPPPPSESTILEHAIGIGTRGERAAWRFRAKRIITGDNGATVTMEDVQSAALYKSGKPYLSLHADRVTLNTVTRDVTVSGHVVLETVNAPIARSLRTDTISWNNALQTITIPTATTVTADGRRLTLGSVQWNVATGQITVSKIDGTTKL